MARLRADIWVSAFVRRHAQLGRICVVSRKGDPDAGQIWVEIDHLNGTSSLLVPAHGDPAAATDRRFTLLLDRQPSADAAHRIMREADFDPDLWVVTLEDRAGDHGLEVVSAQ